MLPHDTILPDKSEVRLMNVLDKQVIIDFWTAFHFLYNRVRITELQTFSICVRKYGLHGAIDSKNYSFVRYLTYTSYDKIFVPYDPVNDYITMTASTFSTLSNPEHAHDNMVISFGKNVCVPKHLANIYQNIIEENNELLMIHSHRLTTEKPKEYQIKLSDPIVINILRKLAHSENRMDSGLFKLQSLD